MGRPSSPDSVRDAILRIMSKRVDSEGYGEWMTVAEMLGNPHSMKAGLVHRALYALWERGTINARLNPAGRSKYASQQYRIVPSGSSLPLYVETPGRTAKALAACFGNYTYPQSNSAQESRWQA